MKSISILGAGWLGLRLGLYLGKKWEIKASTTSQDKISLLEKYNFKPYLISLHEDRIEGDILDFLQTDVLVINVPPQSKQKKTDTYIKKMQNLFYAIQKTKLEKLIFVSSTAVYPNNNQKAHETDQVPVSDLLVAEEIFHKNTHFQSIILRTGGLAGYDRAIGKYFSGRTGLANGSEIANLIHADDLIRVIEYLIAIEAWGEIFNVCCPIPVNKEEHYTLDCLKLGLPKPIFGENKPNSKWVSAEKLLNTGFEFIYPSCLMFEYPHGRVVL